jgi:hypothetical protein
VRWGAAPMADREDRAAWLRQALAVANVRWLRHPANHRYAFAVGPRRKSVAVAPGTPRLAYPKRPVGR